MGVFVRHLYVCSFSLHRPGEKLPASLLEHRLGGELEDQFWSIHDCSKSLTHRSMGPRTMVIQIHGYPPKSGQNPKVHYFYCFFNDFLGDIGKFEVPRPRRIDPDRSCRISSNFDPFYIDLDFFQKKKSIFFSFPHITHSSCLPGRLRTL